MTTQLPQSQLAAPPSRRRNERCHQAILKAAAELLEEKGYVGTSIEEIARKAGVGKQTIYRWWSSKAAVVMEAYTAQAARRIAVPDTGLVREDILLVLQQLFAVLTTTLAGRAIAGIIAEAQSDPDLAAAFREQFIRSRREVMRTILQRGIDRGELRSDLDIELVVDVIYGSVWYRLLLQDLRLDDNYAQGLIFCLLGGIEK